MFDNLWIFANEYKLICMYVRMYVRKYIKAGPFTSVSDNQMYSYLTITSVSDQITDVPNALAPYHNLYR